MNEALMWPVQVLVCIYVEFILGDWGLKASLPAPDK